MALRAVLFTNATSGTSVPQDLSQGRDFTVYLTGSGTISGGTLILEEADYNVTDPGSTISLAPATWSSITGDDPIDCDEVTGGAAKAYQLPPGAYGFVRARFGDAVTGGGTVSVVLRGV